MNTTTKRQVSELFEPELELGIINDEKYNIKTIQNSIIYDNKIVGSQLPRLYYSYLKSQNI